MTTYCSQTEVHKTCVRLLCFVGRCTCWVSINSRRISGSVSHYWQIIVELILRFFVSFLSCFLNSSRSDHILIGSSLLNTEKLSLSFCMISALCSCNILITLFFNPLNPELNPICYLLALLGAHHFLHVSRIRVKLLTFRLLMSYICIYIWSTHSWCF